jgi:hypothetical protein
VLAFQDVIRLNEPRVEHAFLRRIARHHRREDTGHDRWFLRDLERLGIGPVTTEWMFGSAHQETRDASYALVAEVFRAEHDSARITLILALEAAGHMFFERIAPYTAARGLHDLEYFAGRHLAVEKDHQHMEDRMRAELERMELGQAERRECVGVVNRVFQAFDAMFDAICRESDADWRSAA